MSAADNVLIRRSQLSPERRGLLEKLMRGRAMPQMSGIPRRAGQGPIPTSSGQERLWFLDQLAPGTATYNMPFGLRLTGHLDLSALQRSLDTIVERHEALRTTFPVVDGRPTQRVDGLGAVRISFDNLEALSLAERTAEAHGVAADEARRPFDLSVGPLLRVRLLRLDAEEHILLLTMHHIVSDAWSFGVLVRELVALYAGFAASQTPRLSELPIQYGDYAAWQRQRLTEDAAAERLGYWQQHLAGAPALLELPTDRPRPSVQSYRGTRHFFALSASLLDAVRHVSQQEGCTPFMALLAAFEALLFRYTGQDDLVVGTPVANRSRRETEPLIGFFVNTLALRTSLAGNPTFRDLLKRLRETTLEAFAREDVPFEQVVESLQVDRGLSYAPLFQVMFVYQSASTPTIDLPGLSVEFLDFDSGTSQVDLTLELSDTQGCFEYSTDLFDAATIERLAGHFETLLTAAVSAPDSRLFELPLLTPGERRQLDTWNATTVPYPTGHRLHQLIEAQVERTPDAVAVTYEDQRLTYHELNARANQVAQYLRDLGVGPDTRVGICMERSLELVIGLLGILKAGGGYVPLDPTYPRERLTFMLEDARTPVLLTQRHLLTAIPAHAARTLCLDADWDAIARASAENPINQASANDLAYVIFTSGSTGRPKGAMNSHGAICNRLLWMQDTYQLGPDDRVLQKTPFSFDVSVWEFFWPLMTGARLVVARPGGHQDSAYLVDLIRREGITTIHFVPSMLQIFVEEPDVSLLPSLRRVICSGEALPYELQERFLSRLGAELHNLYGPTEAAVDVTYWACEQDSDRRIVPIGRPIANTQMHVLDPWGRPVPVGVPGELFIGGVNLARGYLDRPDLTAERFVPDPFGSTPGARLYRTGDRARFLPDGAIEYLGRLDFQVKLRGFRIELGEIEAALADHPTVRDCVVSVHDGGPSGPRLVAYVVPADSAAGDLDHLKAHLEARLPVYMVPTTFVALEALPLSPNGKLDRRALPAPDTGRAAASAPFVAPQTAAEQTVAAIWQAALGAPRVGLHDNFFDLGGHSLLLARVHAELRRQLGTSLTLIDLFKHPTVSALARALTVPQPAATPTPRVQDRAALQRQAIQRQQQTARQRAAVAGSRADTRQ